MNKRVSQRVAGAAFSFLLLAGSGVADEVRIGATAPLSGPQADFGVSLLNGIELYFEEINARGGVGGYSLVLVKEDDKADPKEGTLIAQKFCDDERIMAVIGPMNSGVQLAALPVYADCNMPEISLGASLEITAQGAENIVRPASSSRDQGDLAAKYAWETLGVKNVAVLHDKQAFGQATAEAFSARFENFGGKIAAAATINATDVDFNAVITQMKAADPELVYLGAVMPQLALFAKQMHEQGLDVTLIVPDGAFTPDFIQQAGGVAVAKTLVSFAVPPTDATPGMASFAQRYREKFGNEAAPLSILGNFSGQILAESLENTKGLTRGDIIASLKAVEVETLLGPISFHPNGETKQAPVFLYDIKDNDFRLIASAS